MRRIINLLLSLSPDLSKVLFKSLLILPALFFTSCEQESVIENSLPYEEYVVVNAQLEGNEVFKGISFTKTLPLDVTYNIKDSELKDVDAYLQIDGIRIIPLKYTTDGIYKPSENITIQTSSTYELFARWKGRQIYAKTIVPEQPDAQRARINGIYLNGEVSVSEQEVIGATWIIAYSQNSISAEADNFYEIKNPATNNAENISVRTIDIPEKYRQIQYRSRYYMRFYAFDKQYGDYFKTQNGNQPINNIFAQGASTIVWNVTGEKTIGLFIGYTKSIMIKAE
jgi:hypothetical protein